MSLPRVGYTRLSPSCGLKVSKIILGMMSYGKPEWAGWVLPEEESIKHIKAAWEMGINTFDTADVYSNGYSEVILGKAIKELKIPREEVVVMTKVHMPYGKTYDAKQGVSDPENTGFVNLYGLSRKHIFDGIKKSLERLQLDYVDVLQIHRFDYETPIEETMQALYDVVKAGYARYIGASSMYAYQFHTMQQYAISHNLTPFISMQNYLNAVYREEEREMVPLLKQFGVGMIPWSPMARGFLTRPHGDNSTKRSSGQDVNYERFVGLSEKNEVESVKAINDAVAKVAQDRGISMAQVALAWVASRDGVSAPIVGTTKLESLRELVEATKLELTKEEIESISKPYRPRAIRGHA